jgi:hypothetical protein
VAPAIGEILDHLDDSVTVLITSGDGMAPNYSGCHLVPEVLNRLGLFYSPTVGQTEAENLAGAGSRRPKRSAISALRDAIPLSVRQAVTRCLPHRLHYMLSMRWANADLDWSQSKVFCMPTANEAYLRVNLHGREPQGIVYEGSEYQDLTAQLSAELQKLVNPQTNSLAAQRVLRTDDVFSGAQRSHLPDLVVTWDLDARVLSELQSDSCGLVQKLSGYQTPPYYSGNHRPNAFVLARGPRIPQGAVLSDGHIIDIAPTLLAFLGVDPPDHMRGALWPSFLGEPVAPMTDGATP